MAYLLALACCVPVRATTSEPARFVDRQFIIDTWETENGLPENSATAMVQTPDGFLWFGTFNGLVRFDGVRFEVFNPGNTPGLPGAGIVNLHLDQEDRLWVSTLNGLAIREGSSWRHVGEAQAQSGDVVRSFAQRPDGAVLLTTFDGRLLEWSDGVFTTLPPPTGEPRQSVGAADGDGRWWVVNDDFVGAWDGSKWMQFGELPAPGSDLGCASARDGGVWIVVGQELRKYSSGARISTFRLTERVGGIWSMFEDSRNNVWICTHDRGICRICPDGALQRWDSTDGLTYDGVRFAFEDQERNTWVGTSGGGLNRFRARRAQSYGVESGITERVVKTVWPDGDGSVLIGTYGRGLFRLTGERAVPVVLPEIGGGSLYVQSVVRDRAERMWVGTYAAGLFLVDGDLLRHIDPQQTGGDNIIAMFEDSRARMWLSGGQAVAVYDAQDAPRVFESADGASLYGVCAFAEDDKGRILATNRRSVFRLEHDRFVELRDSRGDSLPGVLCLKPVDDGAIWMGTSGAGLMRWRAGTVDRVDDRAGFLTTSVHAILEDARGYWWLPGERGVLRVARAQLEAAADGGAPRTEFQVLGTEDGLASVRCSSGRQPVCGVDPAGRFWFATDRGAVMLNPDTFEVNGVPPPVQIEGLSYLTDSPSHGEPGAAYEPRRALPGPFNADVTVPPGSRSIEFRYTAPSFANPPEVRFEVMLGGLDRRWYDVGTQRSMIYHGIAPGRYTFRVRAANDDGVWNEAGDRAAIIVTPYFWQTVWFRIVALLALAGVSAGSAWWLAHARTAQRLREDADFRTLVEAAPNAMVLIDQTGEIALVNAKAEREFGWPREEMIGKPIDLLMPNTLLGAFTAPSQSFTSNPGFTSMRLAREFTGCRSDGSRFPLEIILSKIRTRQGPRLLASIVNISERKQRDLELARQHSELTFLSRVSVLGELSGAIAHELNQPLTAILSNAQAAQHLMVRDPIDTAEVSEILADIVEQDKRAGEVIHRLRALLTKGETTKQSLDLSEVVREVMPLLRSDFLEHGVDLHTELRELPSVLGDRVQLQQVLINLLINGCHAMEGQPVATRRLTVRSHTEGTRVTITVTDTGPGIEPDLLDRIFNPFVTTKPQGMGLGLAVCRTIVESHGGQISAENNAAGGATLKFTIAVEDEGAADG